MITGNMKMVELIRSDYRFLLTLSRFNIPLGFGNSTIEQLCKANNVDLKTFLMVVNKLDGNDKNDDDNLEGINLNQLIMFLKNTHSYFFEYRLPLLQELLSKIVDGAEPVHKALLIDFFDKYDSEVRKHMLFEEKNVYPYVENCINKIHSSKYTIDYFEQHHNDIEKKINDLRNIIIKYLPPLENINVVNDMLYMLFQAEDDLNRHTLIEEKVLFPCVRKIESSIN